MRYLYRFAALQLASDFEFRELDPWRGPTSAASDIKMREGFVPPQLEQADHTAALFATRGRKEYLQVLPGTGRLLIKEGRMMIFEPERGRDATDNRAFLMGASQSILWHQRGLLPLQASAVIVGGQALLFAGRSGSGKSTLAAALAVKGHRSAADDMCVIDVNVEKGPVLLPSFPRLRLWPQTLAYLNVPTEGLARALSHKRKFLLAPSAGFVDEPQRIAAILMFGPRTRQPPRLERIDGTDAAFALDATVHMRRAARALGCDTAIFAALSRLIAAGVSVWRLTLPADFALLDSALDQILSTLG